MFEQALGWISRSPRVRKVVVKTWRAFLRLQRATLAHAVLVARRPDDCVLAVTSPSGKLRLPSLELDGWEPVGAQVQAWADGMLRHPSKLKLEIIDGTPGKHGVTFLYLADVTSLREIGDSWVDAELARSALCQGDRRLLTISGRGKSCIPPS